MLMPHKRRLPLPTERVAHLGVLLAQCLVLAVVLTAPWMFGGMHPWFAFWATGGLLIAAICALAGGHLAGTSFVWATGLLTIGWLYGSAQLVTLPIEWLSLVSPQAAESWQPLGAVPGEESRAANPAATTMTEVGRLTIYAWGTRHTLSLLALALATFWMTGMLFAQPGPLRWLLTCVVINGVAIALVGIGGRLSDNGMLMWRWPLLFGTEPFGPFVSRNSGAGYLNMCIAALLAWFVFQTTTGGRRATAAWLDPWTLAQWAALATMVAGILCSLSRGAAIGMMAATIVTALAAIAARRSLVLLGIAGVTSVAALGLVAWVGMTQTVEERLDTLTNTSELLRDGRLANWQPGWLAAVAYLPFGSGYGSYRHAYPPFQSFHAEMWFRNPENLFLQAFTEGGLVGAALLLALLGVSLASVGRLFRHASHAWTLPLAVCGSYLLVSQGVHWCCDVGPEVVANLLLMAALGGVVMNFSGTFAGGGTQSAKICRTASTQIWCGWTAVLISLAFGLMFWRHAAPLDAADRQTYLWQRELPEVEFLAASIPVVEAALRADDGDVAVRLRLAELYSLAFRVARREQLRAEYGSTVDEATLSYASQPSAVARAAWRAIQANDDSTLQAIRTDRLVQQYLVPAYDVLLAARQACPASSQVHLWLAEVCFVEEGPAGQAAHIQRAVGRWPANARNLMKAGLLEIDANRSADGLARLRRMWELAPTLGPQILRRLRGRLNTYELIEQVIPASPEILIGLATTIYADLDDEFPRQLLATRARELLSAVESPTPRDEYLMGQASELLNDDQNALLHYQRAAQGMPTNPEPLYRAAVVHARNRRWQVARALVQRCVELDASQEDYQTLLQHVTEQWLRGGEVPPE